MENSVFRLKEIRLENGLKRSELARLTGIHQNTIANYENGERQAPYETLILFADFFSVSLDELLGREGTVNPNPILPSSHEQNLLNRYRALPQHDRERIDKRKMHLPAAPSASADGAAGKCMRKTGTRKGETPT